MTSIYHAHSARVLAYALRRTTREDAEEVVAETFAVAWRRLGDVPDGDPIPWLLAVARRVLANQRRAIRRRAALDERVGGAPPGRDAEAFDPAARVESRDVIRDALQRLTERDREAILLVAWDGLDNRSAAIVMGCSPAKFAVRLHRARQRLARSLSSTEPPMALATTPEEQT